MEQPAQIITEPTLPPVSPNLRPQVPFKKSNKIFLVIFLGFLGLILAGGLVFAGVQIGKKQSQISGFPTPIPTEVLTPTATLIPTEAATPSPIPSTPTPDLYTEQGRSATAVWKTYTNSALWFELKYPNTWTTKPFSISTTYPIYGVVELVSDIKAENMNWPSIQIQHWENPENLTLEQLEQKYTSSESGLGPKIYQAGGEWIKIGGVDAYRLKKGDCEPFNCDKVSILYKQKVFVIQNYLVIPEEIYNQILSTFKFLE